MVTQFFFFIKMDAGPHRWTVKMYLCTHNMSNTCTHALPFKPRPVHSNSELKMCRHITCMLEITLSDVLEEIYIS